MPLLCGRKSAHKEAEEPAEKHQGSSKLDATGAVSARSSASSASQPISAQIPAEIATDPQEKRETASPARTTPPPAPRERHEGYEILPHSCTTVLIRNLVGKISQETLLDKLPEYRKVINFAYVPIDFRSMCNLGYGFLNLVDHKTAQQFATEYDGRAARGLAKSGKKLVVQAARVQGLAANIRRFQNSAVLPDELKPLLLRGGDIVPFPPPDAVPIPTRTAGKGLPRGYEGQPKGKGGSWAFVEHLRLRGKSGVGDYEELRYEDRWLSSSEYELSLEDIVAWRKGRDGAPKGAGKAAAYPKGLPPPSYYHGQQPPLSYYEEQYAKGGLLRASTRADSPGWFEDRLAAPSQRPIYGQGNETPPFRTSRTGAPVPRTEAKSLDLTYPTHIGYTRMQ